MNSLIGLSIDIIVTLFDTLYTKNPPQTNLRGIFVEHRRIELLTF